MSNGCPLPSPRVPVRIVCRRCGAEAAGRVSVEALTHLRDGSWALPCPGCGSHVEVREQPEHPT